jgi:hypothetical protein
VLAAQPPSPPLQSTSPASLYRVLFVGNSYTFFNSMPDVFVNVSAALPSPRAVNVTMLAPGGSAIFQHGNLSLPMGRETAAALADPLGWDAVVLQDQSEVAGGGRDTDDNLGPGVARNLSLSALSDFFMDRLTAAGAVPVLYSTWGRHDGDPPNAQCCGYGDFLGMNHLTTGGYKMYADALQRGGGGGGGGVSVGGARTPLIAPAGRAWETVFNSSTDPLDPGSRFSCLYHNNASDRAPLTTSGTTTSSSVASSACYLDSAGLGGHPSLQGSYLIALVLAGTIFDQSVGTVGWAPPGVSAADQAYLQHVAQTVLDEEQRSRV